MIKDKLDFSAFLFLFFPFEDQTYPTTHSSIHTFLSPSTVPSSLLKNPKVQADVASYLQVVDRRCADTALHRPLAIPAMKGMGRRESSHRTSRPQTSYAISLMLTHFRFTLAPSYVEHTMSVTVKNDSRFQLKTLSCRDGEIKRVKKISYILCTYETVG